MILQPKEMAVFSALKPLFDLLHQNGGDIRIVGGAVRDIILKREIHDIDLATTLPPETVMNILRNANIKVIPTGIDYGTVTAILDHQAYQITTLRKDVDTDGRHADVVYTDSWEEDAARRDFTFNALYLDEAGTVYDYFGGLDDLKKPYIRFIGEAKMRIHEDVLRILRAFRFQAQLSDDNALVTIDPKSLDACVQLADMIPVLSAERVWQELKRLLSSNSAGVVWEDMVSKGISKYIVPEGHNTDRLHAVCAGDECGAMCRLAAIIDENQVEAVAKRLKLSRAEHYQLKSTFLVFAALGSSASKLDVQKQLYKYGKDSVQNALRLLRNIKYSTVVDEWERPMFPLHGRDLAMLGVVPGVEMGLLLKAVEKWWQEEEYKPDHHACMRKAKKLL